MSADYKSTLFLPRTDFPMRAGLPEREPELLDRWRRTGLFRKLREAAKGREKFILHDGPPYANGHIHIGHALNKILKDAINRSQQMLGKDANYVPGWDCHGLPVEWKIEEKYRAEGKAVYADVEETGADARATGERNASKGVTNGVPVIQFREECRAFAQKWIDVQREEFRRLGVEGDWDNPYTTMEHAAEAQIVRELGKFLMNGGLYKGVKPVLWSAVEKTALAEAEVEYHDHESMTVYVRFPVVSTRHVLLEHASAVIWTTTPWTIPGNRAIAYGRNFIYKVIKVERTTEGSLAEPGEFLVVAGELVDSTVKDVGITHYSEFTELRASDLKGTVCAHPLRGEGYEFDVPLLVGEHVTIDQGTGFVHTAPGHGLEDFELGEAHGLEVPQTVGPDGAFYGHVPLFAGKYTYYPDGKPGDADEAVVSALAEAGALLARDTLVHSYPHSWRSKAPLIFRATPQWFISMSANGLRAKALAAIDETRWVPPGGRNRIGAMVEARPDWCISRQRAWGVPITVFVDKKTGEPLRDQAVLDRIIAAVEAEGTDAWFTSPPERFLSADHDAKDFEPVTDILDVWFDSGSTHSFVLEGRPELGWPASLYLEGSDQHRGWFQSSLLESCGTRGRAPYEAVLTHGFVMDEEGRKMSKSLGNVVAPQEVVERFGADILRLWVVASDYAEDLRIGPEILKHQVDTYRRLRNTLRYLLGALDGFDEAERLPAAEMPELERWVLHRLFALDGLLRRCCGDFDFHTLYTAIHNFCAVDLSAFYFDIRKDSLYCDRKDAKRRRAARTTLDEIFSCLTAWLAPVLCFTAEEAWLTRFPSQDASVHSRTFPAVPPEWRDDELAAKWEKVRRLRRVVTGALEVERAKGNIGSSLQAHPVVYAKGDHVVAMEGVDLAEIAITSGATLIAGEAPEDAFALADVADVWVAPGLAEGRKCLRCWRVLQEVGRDAAHEEVCGRCADAVDHVLAAAS
ncbi:MAG: isoleucine--tRNA ligase [Alphaproteobacteria bacterium]